MYNYHNKKKFIWSIFLILLLAIGIGYAYLTSNLSIAGNTQVTTNTWNIHFENLQVTPGSVTASTPATINVAGDAITYTINLNRPKELYEFTVDIKNEGTLPGKIGISTLSGITTEAEPIIDYSIKYTNGKPVNVGDILNAGAKKAIKVRVFYKDEIDPEDFPSNDLNLTLTYTLQYVQSEEDEFNANALINQLKAENSSCFKKYEGQVTDEVNNTVTASNVYFNKCADKRNIKFAGYCWQMIRTTETGGIKMIYNGEPDNNGECASSRGVHTGIVGGSKTTQNIASEYLYSNRFNYDASTNKFTLQDTVTSTWSDSTYEDLIGKFTCLNTTGVCENLYSINGYNSATTAYVISYTIGDTNYAQIGTSAFNSNGDSPAMVGYMFNKVYNYNKKTVHNDSIGYHSEYMYGSSFTYDSGTNTYTLSGSTSSFYNLTTNNINTMHYTCLNNTGICNTISYVFFNDDYNIYYINMKNGENVSDALSNMLYSNDVNRYDSSIKMMVDNWFYLNMNEYTSYLENTVFCNNRVIESLAGWDSNGGNARNKMYFTNVQGDNYDLACDVLTNQFSVSNNKAKLTYSIALPSVQEIRGLIYTSNINNELVSTGSIYRTISPSHFFYTGYVAYNDFISADGYVDNGNISSTFNAGIRQMISIRGDNVISSGTGSETDPWVIE